MATRYTISEIKQRIKSCQGEAVVLKTNKGRKKVKERTGIIEDCFPSVFTVKVDSGKISEMRISFSYCDVLTETVEVSLA